MRVEVALAIVREGGRYLIGLRGPDVPLPNLWEFPGGKVEPGESPEACAVREVGEELGIRVEVEAALPPVEHDYESFSVRLHPFLCRRTEGEPAARGCAAFEWASLDDLGTRPFPPATAPILALLRGLE